MSLTQINNDLDEAMKALRDVATSEYEVVERAYLLGRITGLLFVIQSEIKNEMRGPVENTTQATHGVLLPDGIRTN